MSNNKEAIKPDPKDIEENRFLAVLSYLGVLCLVPLFLKRDSNFAQFHAKQGLLLFVVELVGWIIFQIPVIGWALGLFVFALVLMGVYNAWEGKYWEMPILGKYTEKLNL